MITSPLAPPACSPDLLSAPTCRWSVVTSLVLLPIIVLLMAACGSGADSGIPRANDTTGAAAHADSLHQMAIADSLRDGYHVYKDNVGRPLMEGRLQGGRREGVWTSYLPKSKSIEGWFNRHQNLEGTLWGAMGRDQMRAPFEKAKKQYQQCSRPGAKVDPREHFLSGTEIAARLKGMIDFINSEPMEGEVFHGVPRAKFDQAVTEFPLHFLEEDKRWLYARNWTTVQVTKGWARVRLKDEISGRPYSLFYGNPAAFAHLEGARVAVYYDRTDFEQPAQIVAADPVTIAGQRYAPGDYLGEAAYFERTGSFLDGDLTGHDIRKQWKNAVMTIYGTIAGHAPSRPLPSQAAKS